MSTVIRADWTVQAGQHTVTYKNINFTESARGLTIVGRRIPYTCLANLFVDGQVRAEFAINNTALEHETEQMQVEIPEICPGEHEIGFSCEEEGTYFQSFTFIQDSPYSQIRYRASQAPIRDTHNDLITATDMLGRALPDSREVGSPRQKLVGLFYWTWRQKDIYNRAVNLTELLGRCPEAEFDIHHPEWTDHDVVHWNQPFYGYYRNDDPYVIRKHMQYFADAGVDVIIFDNTNGSFLWKDSFMPLLAEMKKAREDGIRVPKIAFMLNFAGIYCTYVQLKGLYQDLYKPGLYSDLWFMWEGKPLILAYPQALPQEAGVCPEDTVLIEEIRNFFTYRYPQPLYAGGPWDDKQWGWLEIAPQHGYGPKPDGTYEMCTVGVAQNCRDGLICTHFNDVGTYGRSYTYKEKHKRVTKDSYLYGYNVQEQWDYALEIDPDFVFITGWNEWTMGKWTDESWIRDGSSQIAFVDHYDRERSRDIEPDIDGYLDTYYLQMAANIRRFKGLRHVEIPREPVTIPQGCFAKWGEVFPDYLSHKGSQANREFPGYAGYFYKNLTGRNNIIRAKAAYDQEFLYFYAETAAPIQAEGDHVMELLLDTDRSKQTGWEGYDYIISGRSLLFWDASDSSWKEKASIGFWREGTMQYIAVPRKAIGQEEKISLEFKWIDNIALTDVMNFYKDGDCAPFGRFNYIYEIQ